MVGMNVVAISMLSYCFLITKATFQHWKVALLDAQKVILGH